MRRPLYLASLMIFAVALAGCGKLPGTTTVKHTTKKASPKPSKVTETKIEVADIPSIHQAPDPEPETQTTVLDPSKKVVVAGTVFDSAGATVTGAKVHARSLNTTAPYDATVTTDAGSYVLNGVPDGALIEVVVSKAGWTTRRRVTSFQGQSTERNTFDFGSAGTTGAEGAAFFLSDRPEIASTTPADDASRVDGNNLAYTFKLSEGLDEANRRRFEQAVRIIPANDAANGGVVASTIDFASQEDHGFPYDLSVDGNLAVAPYALRRGSIFMQDTNARASFSWNETGTEATLSFVAPLITSNDTAAAYQAILVSAGENDRIRDAQGNQLGTSADGGFDAYPAAGHLIPSAFLTARPVLHAIGGLRPDSEASRWASTHQDASWFALRRDESAPVLQEAAVLTVGNDTRIDLSFSKPLAAFNGTVSGFVGQKLDATADNLPTLSFGAARSLKELTDIELDGEPEGDLVVDPRAVTSFGADGERDREFFLSPDAFATSRATATTGSVVYEIDPRAPGHLTITIIGRPDFFRPASAMAARAEGMHDVAGNATKHSTAESTIREVAM